ncbi:hypothetical protein ACNQ1U_02930 [Mycoplasma sp. 653B]|uniref:hypothetical protein n=1 Tax=Mycoplasma sp. 653B TaxID=3401677 RepID=UPI003AACEE68
MENTTNTTTLECSSCGASISKTQRTCKYCAQPNKYYESPTGAAGARGNANRPKMDFTNSSNYSSVPVQATSTSYANNVQTSNKDWIDWGLFIVLLIIFSPAAIIYLIVCAASKK